jgi:hypothetical protein
MVEVHPDPDAALSDAEQQLDLDMFRSLMDAIVPVHEHVRRSMATPSSRRRRGRGGGVRRCGRPGEALITADVATVRPATRLRGELRCPATSRSATEPDPLGAGHGESRITGAGDGADVRSTAAIMRALGATVEVRPDDDGRNVRTGSRRRG